MKKEFPDLFFENSNKVPREGDLCVIRLGNRIIVFTLLCQIESDLPNYHASSIIAWTDNTHR